MCDVFNLISLSWYRPHPPPWQQKLIKMRRAWSVISADVQESGRHREQQESPNTGISLPQSHRDTCYREWFARAYLFELRTFWIYVSRFSEINNWSEAHSMGSSNKASSERETKNCDVMWNNFFLIEWSRVHHQYHFLLLLCDITRPIHLVWASLHHSS